MSRPPDTPSGATSHSWPAAHSRLVQRLRRRYADELALLPPGAPTAQLQQGLYAQLRTRMDVGAALRCLRQCVLERLVVLDTEQQAPLAVVTQAMTDLAELALNAACTHAFALLDAQHGAPTKADGQRCPLWVVGMGKLGGRELNVSSDIDLVYVYEEEGETAGRADDGRGRIGWDEYFGKAVKLIYNLVGEPTEHGWVFRMDLALRPNGMSGAPVVSLAALENYFLVQGREWERFAWLKSRVVAPASALPSAVLLRDTVLPFVFRRYLDYSVFESLRGLHQQIRQHAQQQASGRPERRNDVKLGRGGIREIEFTVQLLQVVRAGQFPELRTRATLRALGRLAQAQLMPAGTAQALTQAYTFLRQVEHRIQYLDDQQTHVLPTRADDLAWMAGTLGCADTAAFLQQLQAHRDAVANEFERLLGGAHAAPSDDPTNPHNDSAALTRPTDWDPCLALLTPALQQRMAPWRDHPRLRALRPENQQRLFRLVLRTQQWVSEGSQSLTAALRWCDWIEPLLRRESYLALMVERPPVHQQLLRLLGSAKWTARYLLLHPGVIDELASPALLAERFDAADMAASLQARQQALQTAGEDGDENLLNLLRRAHHAEVFRTLARDVEGRLSVEQVADDLSALADLVLRTSAEWVWQRLKQKHREQPALAILAYGKLGGKELGYGGDLDIVFVYDDPHEQAGEIYAQFVRKLIQWLTVKTGEGDLYEIDTALRPNGNSGLLVSDLESFERYQTQRGSNTAWTWEHQAMTRARFCVGPLALQERFHRIRAHVMGAPRDLPALAAEIVAMRHKLRLARPAKNGLFDLKHSPGGMVDAEFAVQFLVLGHGHTHPSLCDNLGNIALLKLAEQVGLLPLGVGQAAARAYRRLRQLQHRARLDEAPTHIDPQGVAAERLAIQRLWRILFTSDVVE